MVDCAASAIAAVRAFARSPGITELTTGVGVGVTTVVVVLTTFVLLTVVVLVFVLVLTTTTVVLVSVILGFTSLPPLVGSLVALFES